MVKDSYEEVKIVPTPKPEKAAEAYLMDVCPPYSTTCFKEKEHFEMSGITYKNGLDSSGYITGESTALFNVSGRYAFIECVVGHTDDHDESKEVCFIVDGKEVLTVELEPECLPKTVTVPLSYGNQLKIDVLGTYVGIGDIVVK